MNPASLDVASVVASLPGLGTLHGSDEWAVHVASEPAEPARCVTVYDTPGFGPDTDEQDIFRPSFQVRVRAEAGAYAEANNIQEIIREALVSVPVQSPSSHFSLINPTSDVSALGTDDRGRHLLVVTYSAMRSGPSWVLATGVWQSAGVWKTDLNW